MEKEAASILSLLPSSGLSHLSGAKGSHGKEEPAQASRGLDTCTGDGEKSSVTVAWQ